MAVKIPQNIEREDKLVGPLTLKQFLYLLGGAAVVFIVFQYYNQGYLFAHEFGIISMLAGGLALALAFININGRPFMVFLGSLFGFLFAKKTRTWEKTDELAEPRIKLTPAEQPTTTPATEISKSDLEKLATVLDTGGKMKTDSGFLNTHEISTLPQTAPAPEVTEEALGVEDIFEDTDV